MKKMPNLEPNELLGYKLKPEQRGWAVVSIKKRSETAKKPGEVYETHLASCSSPKSAVIWLTNYIAKLEIKKADTSIELNDLEWFKKIEEAMIFVENKVLKAFEMSGFNDKNQEKA